MPDDYVPNPGSPAPPESPCTNDESTPQLVCGDVAASGQTSPLTPGGAPVASAFINPDKFKDLNAVAIGAGATVWTPAAGFRPRLMGGSISVSVASSVLFVNQSTGTTIWRTPQLPANTPYNWDMGNGVLLGNPNDKIAATSSVAASVTGTLYGTEE